MTAPFPAPEFPAALDHDHDDVAWALQTGVVQWNRGGYADGLVWLKRAVDSALEAGAYDRASELTRATDALEAFVEGVAAHADDEHTLPDSVSGGADVDALMGQDAEASLEVGAYEYATQSLVDAVELETRREPPAAEAEDLDDEIDVIEVDEFDDDTEETPIAPEPLRRPPPPPARTFPVPPPRPASVLPRPPVPSAARPSSGPATASRPPGGSRMPPPPPRPSSPARTASRPPAKAPEEVRSYPSPFDRDELPSQPAAQAYGQVPESLDETTTHRRSLSPVPEVGPEPSRASSHPAPAYSDEEEPTGVRVLPEPPLGELDSDEGGLSLPPETTEDEVEVGEASLAPAGVVYETSEPPSIHVGEELLITQPPSQEFDASRPPSPSLDGHEGVAERAAEPSTAIESAAAVDTEPSLGGVKLGEVRGLEDLPPEAQAELAARAHIEVLATDEEVSAFGLAVVLKGAVSVMPAIADVACARAQVGEPVFCTGNLQEGVAMRVVAQGEGAELAVWQVEDFEDVVRTCPWVAEELRNVADRFQALAGATMGPLGEGLDESMRAMITDRCEVKRLEAGDELVNKGKPLPGLHIVGAGRLEVEGGGELLPGDIVFAQQLLGGGATPATVRAGEHGALVLFVNRMSTHELMMSVPPLLEVLATS